MKFFMVYAPELIMDWDPGNALDEKEIRVFLKQHGVDTEELEPFVQHAGPADFIQLKNITVLALGKRWES